MQRIVNMGSVLQAYSLREIVRETSGIQADFLDIEDQPSLPSVQTVKSSEDYQTAAAYSGSVVQRGKRWIIARLSALTKKKIRTFMTKELELNASTAQNTYDHVIVGSDEVFNHSKAVRLQLHGEVKQARNVFTYAASCGSACAGDVEMTDRQRVKDAMKHFSAMSVRDTATEKYVSQFYDGTIERHLDPVLAGDLYLQKHRKVFLKKYLLVYAYGQRIRTAKEIEAIRNFARAKGLKTVAIGGSQFWCDLYLPVSPFRALDYFHFADYVITDTFHGAIFSVINHCRFAVIVRKTNACKLSSLLKDLGLEERIVKVMQQLPEILEKPVDYEQVDKILQKERARTRKYLKAQIEGNASCQK